MNIDNKYYSFLCCSLFIITQPAGVSLVDVGAPASVLRFILYLTVDVSHRFTGIVYSGYKSAVKETGTSSVEVSCFLHHWTPAPMKTVLMGGSEDTRSCTSEDDGMRC